MKQKTYISEMYCGHCDKDTKQKITDGGHERDSSNDKQECLECGWIKLGFTDEWEEPYIEKNCDTCGVIRGYSFYGHCAHCNSKYSGWSSLFKTNKI